MATPKRLDRDLKPALFARLLLPTLVTALACSVLPQGPSTDQIILEPTVGSAQPASPSAIASPTTASQPTAAPSAFRDDFDGTMDTGWTWFKSPEPGFSLTHTQGWLRINLSSGSFFGDAPPQNMLLRPAPTGDFSMKTYLRFSPHNNFEFAGLVVLFDERSVAQLGRAGCFVPVPTPECIGDGLYFDNLQDGAVGGSLSTPAALGLDYVLQLQRQGNLYTASYSTDGSNWLPIGSHTVDKTPSSLGLIAAQSTVASPYADFDYFEMESR